AQNHRSAIRGAMRYAAERRLVPMIFPQIHPDDAWERDKQRYFPLAPNGPTTAKVLAWRSAWTVFGQTFAVVHPELPNELAAVTRDSAEEVITHMQVHDGRYAMGYKARSALQYLAEKHNVGPYAEASPADSFYVQT